MPPLSGRAEQDFILSVHLSRARAGRERSWAEQDFILSVHREIVFQVATQPLQGLRVNYDLSFVVGQRPVPRPNQPRSGGMMLGVGVSPRSQREECEPQSGDTGRCVENQVTSALHRERICIGHKRGLRQGKRRVCVRAQEGFVSGHKRGLCEGTRRVCVGAQEGFVSGHEKGLCQGTRRVCVRAREGFVSGHEGFVSGHKRGLRQGTRRVCVRAQEGFVSGHEKGLCQGTRRVCVRARLQSCR
jgi:hypothetical protein